MPEIRTFWSLPKALKELDSRSGDEPLGPESRILLHPDEGSPLVSRLQDLHGSATMAIGSERGWTGAEIGIFAEHGFRMAQLGGRILKTETAALAAVSILLARMGLM
jgi:16S rRNA (uracil1498-N3)-methyltransferase